MAMVIEWWRDLLTAMDEHQGQAAWAQFAGSLIALLIAIAVPARLEVLRRKAEERDLMSRRRAAWSVMHALVGVLGRKTLTTPTEIRGAAAVLDRLDISAFPEEATSVLVGLHNRIGIALAWAESQSVAPGDWAPMDFDEEAALANLDTIRAVMGKGPAEDRPKRRLILGRSFFPSGRKH